MDPLADLRALWERWRVRLRWKLHLAERNADAALNAARNRSRAVTYGHGLCVCGQLGASDERRCSRCGRRLPGPIGRVLGRAVGVVVPESDVGASAALLVAIVALYALALGRSGSPSGAWTALLSGFQSKLLWSLGANYSALWRTEPWRLVTSCFLHINLWHVGFNVFALVRLGPLIEVPFGTARFVVLYVVTGIAGSMASALWHADAPVLSAGASGALCGLMGAGATYGWWRGGSLGREVGRYLVEWGVWVVIFGLLLGADNAAHAGGAAAGAVCGLLLADRRSARKLPDAVWGALALLCAGVVLASFWLQWTRGQPWPWPGGAP